MCFLSITKMLYRPSVHYCITIGSVCFSHNNFVAFYLIAYSAGSQGFLCNINILLQVALQFLW